MIEPTCRRLDGVDLWSAFLDDGESEPTEKLLSPDELNRARRYRIPEVRRRFTICRAILRRILAGYLSVEPEALAFRYSPHGKPALEGKHALRFNLSHSHTLLMIAITWEREVGIDVERMQPISHMDIIAADYFSPVEYALYQTLPPESKQRAFFNWWTRKEAYIKACGDQLRVPLSGFEVTFLPGEPARLLRPAENDLRSWQMQPLPPPYAGALVVEATPRHPLV